MVKDMIFFFLCLLLLNVTIHSTEDENTIETLLKSFHEIKENYEKKTWKYSNPDATSWNDIKKDYIRFYNNISVQYLFAYTQS